MTAEEEFQKFLEKEGISSSSNVTHDIAHNEVLDQDIGVPIETDSDDAMYKLGYTKGMKSVKAIAAYYLGELAKKKEGYSFSEMFKIVTDNPKFARVILILGLQTLLEQFRDFNK